jgi:hypothetical protein
MMPDVVSRDWSNRSLPRSERILADFDSMRETCRRVVFFLLLFLLLFRKTQRTRRTKKIPPLLVLFLVSTKGKVKGTRVMEPGLRSVNPKPQHTKHNEISTTNFQRQVQYGVVVEISAGPPKPLGEKPAEVEGFGFSLRFEV